MQQELQWQALLQAAYIVVQGMELKHKIRPIDIKLQLL
jgi:hypothetical protein